MYDARLSKEIFDQLMNGRIINKTVLNNASQFVDNELYTEIIQNLEIYRQQYAMSGLKLVEHDSYFYVREPEAGRESLKSDITMKACILLMLIGKYITESRSRLSKLTDPLGGLTNADIEAIEEMTDTAEILERCGIKQNLKTAIRVILVERNILLQKASSEVYLLSDAGRAFFDEIVEHYAESPVTKAEQSPE